MAQISDKFSSLLKEKVLLKRKEDSSLVDKVNANLRIIAENSLSFSTMARDINVARQNVQQLVKLMGGETKTGADDQYRKEEQRRKLAETRREEIKAEELKKKKPSPVKDEKKKPKLGDKFKKTKIGKKLGDIGKAFSESNFIKSFKKYFAIAAIVGVVFLAFKETLMEWVGNLWESIKEKFDEFVGSIKQWFNEVVQPIIDGVKEFVGGMIDKITEFFKSIGNWFSEKFDKIKEFFDPIIKVIKEAIDGIFEKIKTVLKAVLAVPGAGPIIKKFLPDSLLKAVGVEVPEKAPAEKPEETKAKAQQATDEAQRAREKSKDATERAATADAKDKKKSEQEEREAADKARQSELEARNKRRKAKAAEKQEREPERKPTEEAPAAAETPAAKEPVSKEPTPAPAAKEPVSKEPTPAPAAKEPVSKGAEAPAPAAKEEKAKPSAPSEGAAKTAPTETPSPKKQVPGAPGETPKQGAEPPPPPKATKKSSSSSEVPATAPTQETKSKPSAPSGGRATPSAGGDVAASGGLKGLNFAERAQVVAEGLKKEGITNNTVIKAILSVAAKESQIGGAAKESGGKAYKDTFYNYEAGRGAIPKDKLENVLKDAKKKRPDEPAPQSGPGAGVAYMNFTFGKNWSKDKWTSVFEEEDFFKAVGYAGGEKYLGRGLIGITHDFTFNFLGKFLGIDLLGNPDLMTNDKDIMIKSTAAYLALLAGGATIPPVGTWPKSYTPEKLQEFYKLGLEKLNSGQDYKEATGYVAVLVGAPGRAKTKESTEAALAGSYSGQQQKSALKYEGKITEALSEKPTQAAQGAPVMTGAGVPLTSGATGKPVTSGYPTETPKPKQAPKTEAPPKKGDENKVERDAIKSSSTVEAAAKMIGLNENEHKEQLQEFLNKYSGTPWLPIDTDAGAWCAKFTNAILRSIGFPGSGNNLALSFLKYGGVVFDKEKRIGDITAAKPGDLMLQSRGGGRGHVAFIESISGSNAIVVGGNQKGKPGENHGGGVTRMPAPLKSIVAIRRPGMPYTEEAIVPTNEEANKVAYGPDAGGPSLHAEGTPKKTPTGSDVGRASTDIAAQQRQQQKPTTPNVINSPTTNNTNVVQNNPPSSTPPPKNTASQLVQRAA